MKSISYFFSPQSPWTYLGHERLIAIAKAHNASITVRPCALNKAIFRYRAACRSSSGPSSG